MNHRRLLRTVLLILILIALILASGRLYTSWQIRRGEALLPPQGKFVDIDGVRMHYLIRGDGPPIVFIHGMAGVLQDFTFGVIDSLARSYTSIVFDRLGAGYSDILPLDSISLGTHTHYLHEAVKKLGFDKPLIVGHSYGGGVALAYALWYPDDVSGLVLLAPAAYPVNKRIEHVVDPLLWHGFGPFLVNTLYLPLRRVIYPYAVERAAAPDMAPAGYIQLKQHVGIRPGNFLTQLRELNTLDENLGRLSADYGRLTLPVTIITGDQDQILNPDSQSVRLSHAIAQSRLIIVHGAGHLLPQCRAADIVPYIRSAAEATHFQARKQD